MRAFLRELAFHLPHALLDAGVVLAFLFAMFVMSAIWVGAIVP